MPGVVKLMTRHGVAMMGSNKGRAMLLWAHDRTKKTDRAADVKRHQSERSPEKWLVCKRGIKGALGYKWSFLNFFTYKSHC